MTAIYHVLIVGAGKIGAFFDTPESECILTHAHGIRSHRSMILTGFVDCDGEKAQQAAQRWNCRAFPTIEEAFRQEHIEIACVAVPDDAHEAVLHQLSDYPVKCVFAEKPLATTLRDAERIVRLYEEKPIPLVVNYSRRFVPEFEELRQKIHDGSYGKYLTGTGYYGKGLFHNGSHMLDIIRFLLDDINEAVALGVCDDYFSDDPSISARLAFPNGAPFFLQAVDCRAYTLFECDLLFEKNRVRILDSGFLIEEYDLYEHPIFKGYTALTKYRESKTSLGNAMAYAIDNIYGYLTKEEPIRCTAIDGLKAIEACHRLKCSLNR